MINIIRKYRQNKKLGKTRCSEILGEEKNLFEFWKFVKNNGDNLELVYNVLLLQFCEKIEFNSENLQFYKHGLRDFYNFFVSTYQEIENKKLEKELDAKLRKENENREILMP